MKILFISDIHGIPTYLNIVNKYIVDTIVILGDLYNHGYSDNSEVDNDAVKEFLINNRHKLILVQGNCDSSYDLTSLNFPLNDSYIKITDANVNIFCTHGNLYNYHKLSYLGSPGVLIYGHEHFPYIEKFNDMIYICVGSISRPRGGSKPSFCIYENHTFKLLTIDGEEIQKIDI